MKVNDWEPRSDAEKVVHALIGGWTDLDSQRAALEAYLAPDVEWWNGGWPTIHGRDTAVMLLDMFAAMIEMTESRIEVKHVASNGNVVFTERVDRLYRADGSLISEPPIVGIFEVADGLVQRWREYEDPRHLFPGGKYPDGLEDVVNGMLAAGGIS
jgi:limonene-1,2-epoxide hydrolase